MITVCPLSAVKKNVALLRPSHLISLLDPDEMIPTPEGFPPERHLRVGVNDISVAMDGYILPEAAHVASVIDFLSRWRAQGPLLVHCWAGISRSTATAFIALCLWNEGREKEAAKMLRRVAPHAQPNRRIVELADQQMQRQGRMIDAILALPPARIAAEGTTFSLPHLLDKAHV